MGNTKCCIDARCESGLRNNYFVGKRLAPDSFRVEQRYLVDRRQLLNRAIHGWGVVYGYSVKIVSSQTHGKAPQSRLEIGPGLALDECGRELVQNHPAPIDFDDLVGINEDELKGAGDACWLLSVHYAEQDLDPVTLSDSCSCQRQEWDHVCETVRYSLRRVDCKECCNDPPCELNCECAHGPCAEKAREIDLETRCSPDTKEQVSKPLQRGGCQCICEHLTDFQPEGECCRLIEIDDPCGRVRVDLRQGVPLACIRLRQDDCKQWIFDTWIEACGPRRLVKRNDLLFDLIRGCDLTRIRLISWGAWHRKAVDLDTFQEFFGNPQVNGGNLTKFTIGFSRPVRSETLKPDCFAMTATFCEREGGWSEPLRVPIVGVHLTCDKEAAGVLATEATLLVKTQWVNNAVRGDKTRFEVSDARVEIEVRGDYILDCNGQAVDANAVGLSPIPTGNGTPGGTFLSTFQVEGRRQSTQPTQNDTASQAQGA